MREILFRGKTFSNDEWVEGCLLYPVQGWAAIASNEGASKNNVDFILFDVDPDTVGQFTGLYDKNGKRIFEGDVVIYDNSPYNAYCKPIRGVIVWRNGSLCFKYRPWSSVMYRALCSDDFFAMKCEVIGNIHDNPELLEVEK